MGFSNSILALVFTIYLYKKNYSLIFAFLILVTNYYLLTMFFTLERTKFAFLFFLIALINKRKIFLLIAVFSHSIILFPIFANLAGKYISEINNSKYKEFRKQDTRNKIIKLFSFVIISFFVYYYLGEHLVSKFNSYAFVSFEIYQILIIFFFSYITTSNKIEVSVFFLFIIISILILGGDRLNMLGYFAFLHYGNIKNPLFKKITILLILYYFVKSVLYINMIITKGG